MFIMWQFKERFDCDAHWIWDAFKLLLTLRHCIRRYVIKMLLLCCFTSIGM